MTAFDKIKESTYNLNKLKNTDSLTEEYVYAFNNFIASARSILDHLLEDYNKKFKLKIPINTPDLKRAFHDKAKQNTNVASFIKWYEIEYTKIIENKEFGFLIKKRNVALHRQTVKPKKIIVGLEFPKGTPLNGVGGETLLPFTIGLHETKVDVAIINKEKSEGKTIEVEAKAIRKNYFGENEGKTIEEACSMLLNGIKEMVFESRVKFLKPRILTRQNFKS